MGDRGDARVVVRPELDDDGPPLRTRDPDAPCAAARSRRRAHPRAFSGERARIVRVGATAAERRRGRSLRRGVAKPRAQGRVVDVVPLRFR
jgi:hypothetical protein